MRKTREKRRIHDREPIRRLADGTRSSTEIAALTGYTAKFVQGVLLHEDLPRLPPHSPYGSRNSAHTGGATIDLDGYILMSARWHPNCRANGSIYAHRLVYELSNGICLTKKNVIDHIDGLKQNNHPSNLRLFRKNSEHLKETLAGQVPRWTLTGWKKMNTTHSQRKDQPHIDSYHLMKRSGASREQQTSLVRAQFGADGLDLLRKVFHMELGLDLDFLQRQPDRFLEVWKSRAGR